MRRSAKRCPTSRLAVYLALWCWSVLGGCANSGGVSPAVIPPCPDSVLIEVDQPNDLCEEIEFFFDTRVCLSDEAMNDLLNHCESLEVLRR